MRGLILLVGNNPLPIWVSWRYLLSAGTPFDKVVLLSSARSVHSAGTYDIALRLAEAMKQECIEQDIQLPRVVQVKMQDPADAGDIAEACKTASEGLTDIHVNYTGGTKPMALGAFRTLSDVLAPDDLTFSYLDARTFQLRLQDGPPSPDLRDHVKIDIDQLCRLHGIKVINNGLSSPRWPKAAEVLRHAWVSHRREMADWAWQLESKERDDVRAARSLAPVPWPEEWAPGIGHAFAEELGIGTEPDLDLTKDGPIQDDELVVAVRHFFRGGWLEEVVLGAVKRVAPKCLSRMNYVCHRPASRRMEIDVAVLRGYQLFLFSCSRSLSNATLKNKGFEVAHRAAQLGGEEARAVLITVLSPDAPPPTVHADPYPNVFDMRADLGIDLGGAFSVRVLGARDLEDPDRMVLDVLEGKR